jgi:hypothetical protein
MRGSLVGSGWLTARIAKTSPNSSTGIEHIATARGILLCSSHDRLQALRPATGHPVDAHNLVFPAMGHARTPRRRCHPSSGESEGEAAITPLPPRITTALCRTTSSLAVAAKMITGTSRLRSHGRRLVPTVSRQIMTLVGRSASHNCRRPGRKTTTGCAVSRGECPHARSEDD